MIFNQRLTWGGPINERDWFGDLQYPDHARARPWSTGTSVKGRNQELQEGCGCRPQWCNSWAFGSLAPRAISPDLTFPWAWWDLKLFLLSLRDRIQSSKGCAVLGSGERGGHWAHVVQCLGAWPAHLRYSRQKIWDKKLSSSLRKWNNSEILTLISAPFNEG